jgi:hypothetical protein
MSSYIVRALIYTLMSCQGFRYYLQDSSNQMHVHCQESKLLQCYTRWPEGEDAIRQ